IFVNAVNTELATQAKRVEIKMQFDGKAVEQAWDIASADHVRFQHKSAKYSTEMIVIGRVAYIRGTTGWTQTSLGPASVPVSTPDWLRSALKDTISEVKFIGDEMVAGQSVKHYEVQTTHEDAFGLYRGKVQVWIDPVSHLLARASFAGTYGGKKLLIEETITHGASITVNVPTPILNP